MRKYHAILALATVLLLAAPSLVPAAGSRVVPPKQPVVINISVSPEAVQPGGEARVTVRLEPKPGIRIDRYPKIRLEVEAQEGLVDSAKGAVGNDAPPPADRLQDNYYKTVDPVSVTLKVDPKAPRGAHQIPARLKYFFCVAKSGICAPKKETITIPLTVRY